MSEADHLDYKQKIEELDRLQQQIEKLQVKLPIYKMAEYLHNNFCQWNHMDGCSWNYENGDWKAFTHASWLEKAKKVIVYVTLEELQKVVEELKKVKIT